MSVTIDLPFPPSMNAIWRKNSRTVHRAKVYDQWIATAGKEILVQRPRPTQGPYLLTIQLVRPDRRPRDLGNLEKGVSDLLVAHGIVQDDRLAERITLEWVPDGPPCRAIIEPVEPSSISANKLVRTV